MGDIRTRRRPSSQWINRLNLALSWRKWTVGMRLDSSAYWLRPEDRDIRSLYPNDSNDRLKGDIDNVDRDGTSRFRNSIYPAKLVHNHSLARIGSWAPRSKQDAAHP